jgi:uncharacterized surface protein with fasciclin (FAS1) repeats
MKRIFNIGHFAGVLALCLSITFTSCNKDVANPVAMPGRIPIAGLSVGELLTLDTTYSYLLTAITRAGYRDAIFNKNNLFTVFAPNNAAFRASGIPSVDVVNILPLTTIVPIAQYHVIPGVQMTAALIPDAFPNFQAPTLFIPPGAPSPLIRISTYPSRRGTAAWVNNIPVTKADIYVYNGVIHNVARIIAPPSVTLLNIIDADANFSFLRAAINRADSGAVGLNKLSEVLNLPVGPNLTVFAPDSNAFKGLYAALGLPPIAAAANFLPVQTVKAIVSYHVLGVRAFAANLPATAAPVATLLTSAIPGTTLSINATTVKGLANATPANIIAADNHALNGVFHVVNQVLRFQ